MCFIALHRVKGLIEVVLRTNPSQIVCRVSQGPVSGTEPFSVVKATLERYKGEDMRVRLSVDSPSL